MHTFKIRAPLNPGEASIELDGMPITTATHIEFSMRARQLTEIKLTMRGYIGLQGEYREGDIVRVERQDEHSGMLRARVRRALSGALSGTSVGVDSLVDQVMAGLEGEPS